MMVIHREEPGDIDAIRYVNEQAFGRLAEANLVDMLRGRQKVVLSLVAVQDDRVVGHILFSSITIEFGEKVFPALGLAPMAVLPAYQKQGIGSALVKAGLEECRKAGHACVVVVGHPEYYPRFGFAPASQYGIKCEYDVPDEAFMVIELRQDALLGCTGTVKYPPEFNEV
ncbi:MAG: N-acetyltransferase [Nitrososphaera sp.]|nr:N-acetyltransferase [Nitrososphaera sp.]